MNWRKIISSLTTLEKIYLNSKSEVIEPTINVFFIDNSTLNFTISLSTLKRKKKFVKKDNFISTFWIPVYLLLLFKIF